MQLKIFCSILLLTVCSFGLNAQKIWESKFGIWTNVELNNKLKAGQPFDSVKNIFPRTIVFKNVKEIAIVWRIEQLKKYKIIEMNDKNVSVEIQNMQLFFEGDTLLLKNKYQDILVGKFIKCPSIRRVHQ